MSVILVSVLTLGLLAGCRTNAREGYMSTREFNFTDFNKIEVGGAFQVEISRGDTFTVNVNADDFAHIKVEKVGGTLIIRRQGIEWFAPFHVQPKATVTLPELVGLTVSGASTCKLADFQSTNDLTVNISGASRLEAKNVTTGKLDMEVTGASTVNGDIKASSNARFEISGASRVELAGAATDIVMRTSGASKAGLGKFPVQNADIEVSGASNGTVNLNGRLDANVSGASNLYWSGAPIMGNIQTSGASNLRHN